MLNLIGIGLPLRAPACGRCSLKTQRRYRDAGAVELARHGKGIRADPALDVRLAERRAQQLARLFQSRRGSIRPQFRMDVSQVFEIDVEHTEGDACALSQL